ncbi:hypothetical protein [Treponema sp. J25]|uniref:hypothetical protein n=1 Tax=Treponema sp. J25 TaxID=2094121 RepID=UPI001044955E|nr:hypothetical protein [Treponema sp. J25]
MMKKFSISTLIILSLLVGACKFVVGLGPQVDMTGPVLEIHSPTYMENVQPTFTIKGVVEDDIQFKELEITVDRLPGMVWRYAVDSGWMRRSSSEGSWQADTAGKALGDKKRVQWETSVALGDSAEGEYVITVTSRDAFGNVSSKSVQQRTVVVDKTPPLLTINTPSLEVLLGGQSPEDRFGVLQLEDPVNLTRLFNGDLAFSWNIAENNKLKSLVFQLAGTTDNSIYYEKTLQNIERSGSLAITPAEIKEPLTGNVVTGKTYLQVIVDVYDEANNRERASKGWFCYWPEADKPWVVLPVKDENPGNFQFAPNYSLQGQAYDDDGLKEIRVEIYRYQTTTLIKEEVIDLSNKAPRSTTWSITVPDEMGNYTLKARCTDIYDEVSTVKIGHFYVQDVGLPNITVLEPDTSQSLFGDANGNFTVRGSADDDSGITQVKIAWIKPGSQQSEELLKYMDRNYAGWNQVGIDGRGNKVWAANLENPLIQAGRVIRDFSLSLNLFSDLGINGNTLKLENQTFVVWAKDNSEKTRTQQINVPGDRSAPELTIDTVSVHSGGTITNYDVTSSLILPALGVGDTVSFSGTWKDDSTDRWSDKNKIGPIEVRWGGANFVVTRNTNDTWTTNQIVPPAGAVATIEAQQSDWGGNKGLHRVSFLVETDNPVLVRISSDKDDGAYPAGTVISIYLDFNKNVTFSGGASNPTLTLNNGRTASYSSGNGTARHVFQYTVAAGDTNVEKLDVTAIVSGGHQWKDSSGKTTSMTLPTGVNSLAGGKSLCIDTIAPTLEATQPYKAISSAGCYNADKTLFLQVEFSEAVTISGSPRLRLSSGANAVATYSTKLSDQWYLFIYTVQAGENTAALAVTAFELNGATIKDRAGNSFTPQGGGSLDKSIVIDTTAPANPTISGITGGTKYAAQTFTVSGESGATLEYSTDGGGHWQTYTGVVTISSNGEYAITARQTDQAGNISPASSSIVVIVDKDPLLLSVTTPLADGRYGAGTVIDIKLNFRKPITVRGNPSLQLNTTPLRSASYESGSGTTTLTFSYTVQEGDAAAALNVSSLVIPQGTNFMDSTGTEVTSYITLPVAGSGRTLAEQRTIEIVTGVPLLTSATLTGTTLTLTFNRPIYKGSGSLTLEIPEVSYRVPAVLSEARYTELANRLSGANLTTFQNAYKRGTNGATETGPDLDAKYVLDWNTDITDANLRTVLRAAGEHRVSIPVLSSAVVRSGNTLTITLAGSYALPVKGVVYDLLLPAGLVVDQLSRPNPAVTSGFQITPEGVEAPIIRIRKSRETLALTNGVVRASQPLTAQIKMECRTPGATVYYTESSAWYATQPIDPNINTDGVKPTAQAGPPAPAEPTTSSTSYTASFTIGSATDLVQGLKYRVRARAYKDGVWSSDAWEQAYRSVLRFNNDGPVSLNPTAAQGYSDTLVEQPWVRGGDAVTGSVLTPGFPLSWDENDYGGIRLMTLASGDPTGNSIWYWVSWDINTTAYVGLLLGTTPTDVNEATNYGPKTWGWGKNAWVPFKEYYPLFPGESRTLQSSLYATIQGVNRGSFMFGITNDGGTKTRP